MSWIIGFAILAVIALIGRRVWSNRRASRQFVEEQLRHRGELADYMEKLKLDDQLIGCQGASGLAIDWDRSEVVLVIRDRAAEEERDAAAGASKTPQPFLYASRRISAGDLLRFSVVEDHYLKTNKTGGKRKHRYRRIELKLNIADRFAPVAVVLLFSGDALASGPEVRSALDTALFWEGMLFVLRHRASASPSVDDQLEALQRRKQRGELTESEYKREHARLKAAKILGYSLSQPKAV